MNSIPLLSIVIPTRNRIDYVRHAIQSVLDNPSPELELVVHDSSDSRILERWVREYVRDQRLSFAYAEPPLSMTDNFNHGMEMATGEYVCVIGDDDGVNPEIVRATQWAHANDVDALVPRLTGASYRWPDFLSKYYGRRHAGKLFINSFSGAKTYVDPNSEMRRCVQYAGQTKFDLPIVYQGIVRRACMIAVREKCGKYFEGVSPDIFGALAVANFTKRVCVVDYPLVLPGASGGSSWGRSSVGKHEGSLRDDPHMKAYKCLVWPSVVPAFFSVETVWAEGAIEALRATGRSDLLATFNVARLHALCAAIHPKYLLLTVSNFYRVLRTRDRSYLFGTLQFTKEFVGVCWQQFKRYGVRLLFYPKRGFREIEFGRLENVRDAVRALVAYLDSTGNVFDDQSKPEALRRDKRYMRMRRS